MKRPLACLAVLAFLVPLSAARAETSDPIGELIGHVADKLHPFLETFGLKATLYHLGHGMGLRDSLGCKVVPMRTAAVDGVTVKRHTLLFIKETVGLPMPDGRPHDGYWYASDVGGAIHQGRIDLFTGRGASSMAPLMRLNLVTLTVAKAGEFKGCPSERPVEALSDHGRDVAAIDGDHGPGGAAHQGDEYESLGHVGGGDLSAQ